jgi:hypothetical protein
LFSPKAQRYPYASLQGSLGGSDGEIEDRGDDTDYLTMWQDSLAKLRLTEKSHQLPEATVKSKWRDQAIYEVRSTSVAYYDAGRELDNLYDSGIDVYNDIHHLLKNINNRFYTAPAWYYPEKSRYYWLHLNYAESSLLYSNHYNIDNYAIVGIVDYHPVEDLHYTEEKGERRGEEFFAYREQVNLSSIKSIYINTNPSIIENYRIIPEKRYNRYGVDLSSDYNKYSKQSRGCAVFIETYPKGETGAIFGDKGFRKTWLDGYSSVKEFYSPNYSIIPPEPDYRRTLYWNPNVIPDENGVAKVQFHNNSSNKSFNISAETVTSDGIIGINDKCCF